MRRQLGERLQVIRMIDVYATLLTPRQQQLLRLYYHEDLSLAEIAERFGVTRQAIHDSLKRSLNELRHLEGTLRVAQRGQREERNQQEPRDPREQRAHPAERGGQDRSAPESLDDRLTWVEGELTRLAELMGDPRLVLMARRIRGLRERL
ncbi:MAG: HTH domain-containing protein [Armatimonadetes bacterium]|nr:HTH domain-containing protein [Armatimonadota bacterium]